MLLDSDEEAKMLDPQRNTVPSDKYSQVKRLAKGSYGEAYLASAEGEEEPSVVIKEMPLSAPKSTGFLLLQKEDYNAVDFAIAELYFNQKLQGCDGAAKYVGHYTEGGVLSLVFENEGSMTLQACMKDKKNFPYNIWDVVMYGGVEKAEKAAAEEEAKEIATAEAKAKAEEEAKEKAEAAEEGRRPRRRRRRRRRRPRRRQQRRRRRRRKAAVATAVVEEREAAAAVRAAAVAEPKAARGRGCRGGRGKGKGATAAEEASAAKAAAAAEKEEEEKEAAEAAAATQPRRQRLPKRHWRSDGDSGREGG